MAFTRGLYFSKHINNTMRIVNRMIHVFDRTASASRLVWFLIFPIILQSILFLALGIAVGFSGCEKSSPVRKESVKDGATGNIPTVSNNSQNELLNYYEKALSVKPFESTYDEIAKGILSSIEFVQSTKNATKLYTFVNGYQDGSAYGVVLEIPLSENDCLVETNDAGIGIKSPILKFKSKMFKSVENVCKYLLKMKSDQMLPKTFKYTDEIMILSYNQKGDVLLYHLRGCEDWRNISEYANIAIDGLSFRDGPSATLSELNSVTNYRDRIQYDFFESVCRNIDMKINCEGTEQNTYARVGNIGKIYEDPFRALVPQLSKELCLSSDTIKMAIFSIMSTKYYDGIYNGVKIEIPFKKEDCVVGDTSSPQNYIDKMYLSAQNIHRYLEKQQGDKLLSSTFNYANEILIVSRNHSGDLLSFRLYFRPNGDNKDGYTEVGIDGLNYYINAFKYYNQMGEFEYYKKRIAKHFFEE